MQNRPSVYQVHDSIVSSDTLSLYGPEFRNIINFLGGTKQGHLKRNLGPTTIKALGITLEKTGIYTLECRDYRIVVWYRYNPRVLDNNAHTVVIVGVWNDNGIIVGGMTRFYERLSTLQEQIHKEYIDATTSLAKGIWLVDPRQVKQIEINFK